MSREVAARGAIAVIALAGIVPGAVSVTHAAILAPDLYRMHNHPAAQADPPPYGLRLDELVDATPNHDIFTWDFDYEEGPMGFNSLALISILELPNYPNYYRLDLTGSVYGGLTDGDDYANDPNLVGEWTFEFTFIVGVQQAFADDDLVVDPDAPTPPMRSNGGWIEGPGPGGTRYLLGDVKDGEYSFRLGDENNGQGHQGHDGVSGWGWLEHGIAEPLQGVALSDWIFTVETTPFPSPGAVTLLACPALCALRRRRAAR